ncbi:hypothetical protein Lal_00013141 [Lupinus albus]|nr:hypothetical protein Lal_00013141 [Lupinus albus]
MRCGCWRVRLASTDLVVKVSSRWEVQPSNEAKEPRCRDWLRGRDSLGRGARVLSASVTVDKEMISSIGKGVLAFAAVAPGDTEKEADLMAAKVLRMKLWDDEEGGKFVVSNLTGFCESGRRVSAILAARFSAVSLLLLSGRVKVAAVAETLIQCRSLRCWLAQRREPSLTFTVLPTRRRHVGYTTTLCRRSGGLHGGEGQGWAVPGHDGGCSRQRRAETCFGISPGVYNQHDMILEEFSSACVGWHILDMCVTVYNLIGSIVDGTVSESASILQQTTANTAIFHEKEKTPAYTNCLLGYDIHIHAWLSPRDIGAGPCPCPCLRVTVIHETWSDGVDCMNDSLSTAVVEIYSDVPGDKALN